MILCYLNQKYLKSLLVLRNSCTDLYMLSVYGFFFIMFGETNWYSRPYPANWVGYLADSFGVSSFTWPSPGRGGEEGEFRLGSGRIQGGRLLLRDGGTRPGLLLRLHTRGDAREISLHLPGFFQAEEAVDAGDLPGLPLPPHPSPIQTSALHIIRWAQRPARPASPWTLSCPVQRPG